MAWAAVGNAREVEAITADDLKKFYDTYYQPNNALLVIAGDVSLSQAKASAEKWFGPIPKGPEIPRPAQAGGVPLHLAAWTPGGLRRAGRLGDGWITNALMSLDTMTAMAADYRAAAEAAGRTPHVTSIRFCWPYRSRAAALEKFGDTALAMARTLFDYGAITDLPGVTSSAEITLEEFVRDRFVFGTPEECVETIGRFRDQAGVDDFLTIFRYPTGPDHAAVLEAMELFGTEVLPNLAATTVPA